MNQNFSVSSLRTINRRRRRLYNRDQIEYLDSLPDLSNSESSHEEEENESFEISDGENFDHRSTSSQEIESENDFQLNVNSKDYCEVVISAILTRCRITLSSAELIINLFNNLNVRFSSDPIVFPNVRYLWDKRSRNNRIGVYLLCEQQHSHGPFYGEPKNYGSYICDQNEVPATIRNDKYFLHIQLRDQLELHLPTIPDDHWIQSFDSTNINDISDAQLARSLRNSFQDSNDQIDRFTFTLHSDEVQCSNSSSLKIFPIFVSINELIPQWRKHHFLLVGLFVGKVKPNVSCYLGPICEELRELEQLPISWKSKFGIQHHSTFHVIGLVADAPMRAFLRGSRQYNHTFGCDWCLIEASSSGRSRYYPLKNFQEQNLLKREKEDFILFERFSDGQIATDDQLSRFHGIVGGSPLLDLTRFNIVEGVAVEHMHCMILGILRSLILRGWFGQTKINIYEGNFDKSSSKKELSNRMKEISVPSDFTRSPRDFDQVKFWKSSEYDSFLIYYFPGLAKGLFKPKVINHILCFLRIFQLSYCGPISQDLISELKNLIPEFQKGVLEIYGDSFMTYNLHILSHLPESIQNLGPTKNISSYPLENYMGILKERVRRSSNIAPSLVRIFINDFRYEEVLNSITKWPLSEKEKRDFGLSTIDCLRRPEKTIAIRENENFPEVEVAKRRISDIIGNCDHRLTFFKTISINGKRFSSKKYCEDKIRADHIIKTRDDKIVEIQFLFQKESKFQAVCNLIRTSKPGLQFKGFTGSFVMNFPHLYDIESSNGGSLIIELTHELKKCLLIPSTKFYYRNRKDLIVEPFLHHF